MIKEMIITYDTDDADSECDAPILKRQELVRCIKCKLHTDEEPGMVYCPFVIGGWVENDGFCSLGERKTE